MERDMEYYIRVSGETMLKNLDRRKELTRELVDKFMESGKDQICIVASGSSLNAALTAEWFMNKYLGNSVAVMSPTEYLDYRKEMARDKFLIVISQSGCSTNIIEAVRDMGKDGIQPAVLTGNLEGDLKEYCDTMIEYGVGNETVDYVTLGMITLVEFLILFALEVGRRKDVLSEGEYDDIVAGMRTCCDASREMYEKSVVFVEKFYDHLLHMDSAMIVADGANMGVIREAALKFGETLKIPALYYENEEYIHGPNMQLTPDSTVFFIDTNARHDRIYDVFQATALVTDHVYLVTNKEVPDRDQIIKVPCHVMNEITPLFTVVPFQYISAHVTREKNNFECHPLFDEFEKKIKCKTDDYDQILEKKIQQAKEEEQ